MTPRQHGPQRACQAIVVGASAGGLAPLTEVVARLQGVTTAPVVVVQHQSPGEPSGLVRLLAAVSARPVVQAHDRMALRPVTVYVAPPGYHLLVERDGRFALSVDPPVNYSRPSIDVLLESAAEAYGPALVAIVLSGANADGATGIRTVRAAGGRTIAQTPDSAVHPQMPSAAIDTGCVDAVLAPDAIAAHLARSSR